MLLPVLSLVLELAGSPSQSVLSVRGPWPFLHDQQHFFQWKTPAIIGWRRHILMPEGKPSKRNFTRPGNSYFKLSSLQITEEKWMQSRSSAQRLVGEPSAATGRQSQQRYVSMKLSWFTWQIRICAPPAALRFPSWALGAQPGFYVCLFLDLTPGTFFRSRGLS